MSSEVSCPVCTSSATFNCLNRRGVPVHQHLVVKSQVEARAVPRGDLQMRCCRDCGFVFNEAFDHEKLLYGADYDNSQGFSSFFQSHTDELLRYLVEERGVRGSRVVEIGCGKGSFLRALVAYPGAANVGIGFDPSYVGSLSEDEGRLTFRRSFFGPDSRDVRADVAICRHVIEHVQQPVALLGNVREALAGNENARVFFETPCVDWILRNQVVWDFFYEHCSLFTGDSLSSAFERAGFSIVESRKVFGGQYLWLEARLADRGAKRLGDKPRDIASAACEFGAAEVAVKERWMTRIVELRKGGRVALWGAGAKGATLANLVDPEGELIDCVVDLNPSKQGGFIPGTGHPIVSYKELPVRDVRTAILMNPNYRAENLALLAQANIEVNLCH